MFFNNYFKLRERNIFKNFNFSRNIECLILNDDMIEFLFLSLSMSNNNIPITPRPTTNWKILNTFYTTQANFYNVVVRRTDNVDLNSNAPPTYTTLATIDINESVYYYIGVVELRHKYSFSVYQTFDPCVCLSLSLSLSFPLSLSRTLPHNGASFLSWFCLRKMTTIIRWRGRYTMLYTGHIADKEGRYVDNPNVNNFPNDSLIIILCEKESKTK